MKYLFPLLFLLIFPVESHAKMYKCIDSNGKTVYQTHECVNIEGSEVISNKQFGVDYKANQEKYKFSEGTSFVNNFRKIKTISNGERVNINRHLVSGATTAFYFYADWCGSCKKVGPEAEEMVNKSDNFALRKIDISEKDSPIKDQYKIKSVPYFIVFDEDGKEISRGNRFRF